MTRSLILLALALATAGCGTAPPCADEDLAPLDRAPAFAVVLSDYASTAIALLDGDGEPITEGWIDSGTRASGLTAGLSGDVVLVESPVPGTLALLERWSSDRLTLASFATREPRQIDLRGDDPDEPTGHSPNAQDLVAIDARHALVSRANPSFQPGTPELALGNDLVVVDLEAGAVVSRIDLAADVVLEGGTIVYGRPSSIVVLSRGDVRRVVVGLQRVSDWGTRITGQGAIAVVDPDALTCTELVALEELSGCHVVRATPGAPHAAMVLCTGDAFAPEAERRLEAGIARLALDGEGRVHVERLWRASDHPSAPSPTTGLVPLDAARTVYVADSRGDAVEGVDVLALVDLDREQTSTLLESDGSFVLGSGALDAAVGLLLVPDASARGVHRLGVTMTDVEIRDFVPLPTCRTLPPREIRTL